MKAVFVLCLLVGLARSKVSPLRRLGGKRPTPAMGGPYTPRLVGEPYPGSTPRPASNKLLVVQNGAVYLGTENIVLYFLIYLTLVERRFW